MLSVHPFMLILSLDCAGNGCGTCIWQDGTVLAETTEHMERGQDQHLMPMILQTLQKSGITFEQLDCIAVTTGPGSFTGLRIGLAAARGLGLGLNKPVIGIDRFSIFHEQFKTTGKSLLVVINSRRAELFARFYPANGPASAATMLTKAEIADFIKDNPDTTIIGDTTDSRPIEPEHITAALLASRADPQSPHHLPRPLYLRPPDVTLPSAKPTEIKTRQSIRAISIADSTTLATLHAESFGEQKWSQKQIEDSLALATTKGWGIFENKQMFGFLLCQMIPDQSEILTFCISPSHRRTGAGSRLMQTAAAAALGKGSSLFLETAADNLPAIALYKKLGFEQTGRRPGYYKTGNTATDALLFTLLTKNR